MRTTTALPTGEQHQIRHGDQTVVVVEVGGALRRYTVGRRDVLDGFAADEVVDDGRGQLLVPWPNRVGDGRYRWAGRDHQLPLDEVEARNAIHGLLRWSPWAVRDRGDSRVTLATTLWPRPGYPFRLDVQAEYALTADGLHVTVTARNDGDRPAPYGVGQHPYLTVGTALVDHAWLTVPARRWLRTDPRGLPRVTMPVEGTPYDFRSPRAVGALRLDTAFGDLLRDRTGRCVVGLGDPGTGRGVDVWLGEGADWVQVYSGDTLADPARRRRSLAVEPMSCPPDAFRTGQGLVSLEPETSHTLRWGLVPHG